MTKRSHARGFSLIELVVSLGICVFVIVAMIGLFSIGLKASRDSYNQVQAAGLASQILASRAALPSKDSTADVTSTSGTSIVPIPPLQKSFGATYASNDPHYVDLNGNLVASGSAVYRITCFSGTSSLTGPYLAQVYLMLSWPPYVPPDRAEGKYETTTFISLR